MTQKLNPEEALQKTLEASLRSIVNFYENGWKQGLSAGLIADEMYQTAIETLNHLYGGVAVNCVHCQREAVLPYTDETRKHVSLYPIEGWQGPPLTCPDCHLAARKAV